MLERAGMPFLTTETGEAYQSIRVTYDVMHPEKLRQAIQDIHCLELKAQNQKDSWNLFWRDECDDIHFESIASYRKNPQNPLRLGTCVLKNSTFYLNLPSFKRACLLVPLLHKLIGSHVLKTKQADFINKVFGLTERLPHGFAELFNENELEQIVQQRIHDYEAVQTKCEQADTAEQAFQILSDYTKTEANKRLPYAERYAFQEAADVDPDIAYLGFYIFLRGRELVAIRRWWGEAGYNLADAADEIEKVFGETDIQIIE